MQAAHEQGQLKAEQGKNWRVPIRQVSGCPSDTLVGTLQIFSRVPIRFSGGQGRAAFHAALGACTAGGLKLPKSTAHGMLIPHGARQGLAGRQAVTIALDARRNPF
jgi:hypothetical protein